MYKCLKKNEFEDQDGYQIVAIRPDDKEQIRLWRNSQLDILRQSAPLTQEDQKSYFDQIVIPSFSQENPAQILFSFLFQGTLIGYGGITHINWKAKRGEVSFLLDPKIEEGSNQFTSCFSHFLTLLIQVAFSDLGFNKLEAEVFEFRPQVPNILEEFGFQLEAKLKDHEFKANKLIDSLIYGLLHNPRVENKAVLVTSISKKIPLLKAVKTAASKVGTIQVVGADSRDNIIGKYFVNTFWHCPDTSAMTPRDILEYAKKNKITSIIPTRDGELKFFSKLKPLLEKENIHVMVSDQKTVEICFDKKHFYDVLTEHKLLAIETFLTYEECSFTEFVVKERFGAGSQKLGLKLKPQEAKQFAKNLSSPIFQPFIPGQEYTIDLYRSLEKKVHGIVVRERNLIIDGEAQITTTIQNKELEELAAKTADLLDIYGHAVIQVIISDEDGKPYIVECNPRFGGASTCSVSSGLDSFYWFLLESQGEKLTNYPFKRVDFEVRQIRYPTDKVVAWTKKQ